MGAVLSAAEESELEREGSTDMSLTNLTLLT